MTAASSPRCLLAALLALLSLLTLRADETAPAPIPFLELGAKAAADYKGEAIGIEATADGARLRTGFQKLTGTVTREGLRLESTEIEGGGLRLIATCVGRADPVTPLSPTGTVAVGEKTVAFHRPGLTEEYSVSVDGVRQDFIIAQRPPGAGELRVELALRGAQAGRDSRGVMLTLDGSGRELAYSRLRVVDATGHPLSASLEVLAADRLAVCVDDATAAYPVRIDPTFSDADWISMNPGFPGANGDVHAVAADASGNIYIGGSFSFVGTVAANGIAKWNGSAWSPLGSGFFNGSGVYSLAVIGTDLYVGGNFNYAGGMYIGGSPAKWNGSTWSGLNSGIFGDVYALAVIGSDLYVGGRFPITVSGLTVNNIAKWNGSAWSALGPGTNNGVYALAAKGGDLYVGGFFTEAGGTTVNRIAKWNGSNWSALGLGMGSIATSVSALAVNGDDIYAGGNFITAGEVAANGIAKWDGTAWSALGSGVSGGTSPGVGCLVMIGNDLYAGGTFTTAGGVPASNIAKWNGSDWSPLGSGSNDGVGDLVAVGGNLYASGSFTTIGGAQANRIAKWNGNSWSTLGSGMGGAYPEVLALAVSGSDIYVGGEFSGIGGLTTNRIAKWNGSAWSALGLGMDNRVRALAVVGADLYAGGDFATAGGVSARRVAKWNGSAWSALSGGVGGGDVYALAASGTDLYVGGDFFVTDAGSSYRIAKWNGSAWSALGTGMDPGSGGRVLSLAASGGNLYAGGEFTRAGGVIANSIAKWNGSAWSALGSGISGLATVRALAVSGSDVYAGGFFTNAGGVTVNRIAKWNGSGWSALGSGMNDPVYALATIGSDVYAGGYFTSAGGVPASRIAKWSGSAWSALGTGMDNTVNALVVSPSAQLFVGGLFYYADTTLSPFLAQANLDPTTTQPPILTAPAINAVTNSPIALSYSIPESALAGSVRVTFAGAVTSTLTLDPASSANGPHVLSVNAGNLSATLGVTALAGAAFLPDGPCTVTLSYQDALGNPAVSVSSSNVKLDTIAPVITPPANVTVHATSPGGAAATFSPTVTDATGVTALVITPASGSIFPPGMTTVTIIATDAVNNTATATFTVTVTPLTDTENWRYTHFGTAANVGVAADGFDADGDGRNNAFEYAAGLVPTDPGSTFRLRIETVPGQPSQKKIIFSPRFADRIYVVKAKPDLLTGTFDPLPFYFFSDSGDERTVIDPGAGGTGEFYQVEITKP